jgi:hypothetical protein
MSGDTYPKFKVAAVQAEPVPVCTENLNTDVMVMKSAEQGV